MAAPGDPPENEYGISLLARISNEMVRAQKDYFGKGPVKAKSYFLDDILLCVLRGGLTRAEKTMLDFGKGEEVRDFRQVFDSEMTGRLTDVIEGLTGRKVVNYQSQIMFDPDVVVEVFIFDDRVDDHAIKATAEALLSDEPINEATLDDPPSASGQS